MHYRVAPIPAQILPCICFRLLMYTWVGDMFMPARDPLGKNGPPLESFLRHERQEGDGSSLSSIDDRLLHQIDELLDGRPKEKDKKKKKK